MSRLKRDKYTHLVNLEEVETRYSSEQKRYKVTRKSDGKFIGHVFREHYKPDVNWRGTRIRRSFKGGQKWFDESPDARCSHIDYPHRWRAIQSLLRANEAVQS